MPRVVANRAIRDAVKTEFLLTLDVSLGSNLGASEKLKKIGVDYFTDSNEKHDILKLKLKKALAYIKRH